MQIAVVIPAYHRPRELIACLTALDTLAGNARRVEYHVGVDDDDLANASLLNDASLRVPHLALHFGSRQNLLGRKVNDITTQLDAEAVCWLADDVLPIAPRWDELVEIAVRDRKMPAFCWQEMGDPGNTTYPVVSKRFLDAMGGKLFSEHFPFWFVDTWLAEVYLFVFGESMPIVSNLPLAGKRGKSTMLRELDFWFRFFAKTRDERVMQARRVAAFLGRDTAITEKMLAEREAWDAAQIARAPAYEARFGDSDAKAVPKYQAAKDNAASLLKALQCARSS